jgi:hypothetical protein
MLVTLLMGKLKPSWLTKMIDSLKKKMFYNSLLRYGIQSYMKYCEVSFVSLLDIGFDTRERTTNLPVAIITLSFVLGYPVFIFYFMRTKVKANKSNPDFVSRFNSLFFTLNTEAKYAIYQTTIFLVRRMLLVAVVVFLKNTQFLQFLVMYLTNMPFIYLLIVHPPMATQLINRIEIYNEVIIQLCTLMLIGFSDYPEKRVSESFGWTFIGLASSIIVVTLIPVGY